MTWVQGVNEGEVVGAQIDKTVSGRQVVLVRIETRTRCASLTIDENHAQALILFLQGVVAEIQARSISTVRGSR